MGWKEPNTAGSNFKITGIAKKELGSALDGTTSSGSSEDDEEIR
jgi:hypothetical protein